VRTQGRGADISRAETLDEQDVVVLLSEESRMITSAIAAILARDQRALRREIEAYADERDLWRVVPGITNCGGTLALHLAGNLQHFVGAVLGGTGYARDRAAEFARRDVPQSELLRGIDEAIATVERILPALGDDALGS
jgi:hypothetical protein